MPLDWLINRLPLSPLYLRGGEAYGSCWGEGFIWAIIKSQPTEGIYTKERRINAFYRCIYLYYYVLFQLNRLNFVSFFSWIRILNVTMYNSVGIWLIRHLSVTALIKWAQFQTKYEMQHFIDVYAEAREISSVEI